mgnify:CR=1 FL=1
MISTIQIKKDLKKKLDKFRNYDRETYNDIILRLVNTCVEKNNNKEDLSETIEVLSDPETMRDLAEALEDINNSNKWASWEEIKKENGI